MQRPSSITRRAFTSSLLLASAPSGWAQALGDPQKRLRIIVPYGSGSGVDIASRVIAERMAERIKQAVIVENKPGGSAMVGVAALKNAPADGTTIGIIVSGNAAQPWMTKDLQFDIRKDFTPITIIYSGPLVMTVSTSLPVRTLAEFVAYAKSNPGKISYGSLGSGTTTHLAAELLAQSAGLQMTQIPYKGSNVWGRDHVFRQLCIATRPGRCWQVARTGVNRRQTLATVAQCTNSGRDLSGCGARLLDGLCCAQGYP